MPTLLVIDDDPAIRQFLEALLGIEGYDVCTAADGISGLQAVEEHQPDCVLLDVMMPVMDGYDVLQTLRASSQHRELAVVMISSASDHDTRCHALQLGADRFVPKPFDMQRLLDDIAELCPVARVRELVACSPSGRSSWTA